MRVNRFLFYLSAGFNASMTAWLAQVVATGKTEPSLSDQVEINRFIESFKNKGAGWAQTTQSIWDDTYGIWICANDSPDAWKINIKSPLLYEATEQGGALNKNNDGVAGTGANAANTNLTPSAVMLTDNVSAWGYCSSIVAGMWGTENSATNRFKNLTTEFSTNSTRGTHASNTDEGFWMTNHDHAQQYKWWNMIMRFNSVRAPGVLSTVPMYFSGNNLNGTLQSKTTRTHIFGMSKASIAGEMAIYSCVDEYKRGAWPFVRTYHVDSTPPVTPPYDYLAFIDGMIGRYGSNVNKVFRFIARKQDHNVAFGADLTLQMAPNASLDWSDEKVIVTSEHSKTITVTGSSGTCNYVVNGVSYLCTFNTTLTQTAADWVTSHTAALLVLGMTCYSVADVITITKTDDTATVTPSVVLLTGNLSGAVNYMIEVVDVAMGEAIDGTVIVYYSTNDVLDSARRNFYFKRQNGTDVDGLPDFGNSIELTQDFNPLGQIAGPGGSITLTQGVHAGRIIKPVYARVGGSGNRLGYLYYSDDNAQTPFTQLCEVSNDLTADFEELTCRELTDGRLLILMRSDPLSGTYYSISTDQGATCSVPLFHSPSISKNGFCVTGDGLVVCLGRWPGNDETNFSRAMITYGYESDLTTWRWRFVDDVNNWMMYGFMDWSSVNGIIGSYSRETANDSQSPTKLIDLKYG